MKNIVLLLVLLTLWAGAEEYVYEGRPAAEWAKDLRDGNAPEKAMHALVKIGRDSVPALLPLLRDPNPKISAMASQVLTQMQQDKDTIPAFIPLLKDPNFEIRRTAVLVLGKVVDQPEIKAALTEVLKDRDRAVAEAAEEVLRPPEEQRERLEKARRMDEMRRRDEEMAARDAQKQKMETMLRQQYEVYMKQVDMLIAKGDYEAAARVLSEAQKVNPNEARLMEMRERLGKLMKQKRANVGEQDNLEDNPKKKLRTDEDPPKKKIIGEAPADF